MVYLELILFALFLSVRIISKVKFPADHGVICNILLSRLLVMKGGKFTYLILKSSLSGSPIRGSGKVLFDKMVSERTGCKGFKKIGGPLLTVHGGSSKMISLIVIYALA
jgi:hypothetical protein